MQQCEIRGFASWVLDGKKVESPWSKDDVS